MAPTKSIDKKNALEVAVPALTVGTFVRAAVVANLVVATLVLIVFTGMALGDHDRGAVRVGLWLVPFVTLVVWSSATVLYVVFRAAGLVATLKRLIGQARSSRSGKSCVWDDWLDSPEPHHP